MTMQGMIADLYPRARPKMMSVAAPVLQESATSCTTYSQVSDWVQHNAKTRIRLNTAQRKAKTQTGYCTTHRPGSDWIRHIRQPTADELGSCTTPTAQSQVQCRYNMPTSLGQHHQTDLILWTCWIYADVGSTLCSIQTNAWLFVNTGKSVWFEGGGGGHGQEVNAAPSGDHGLIKGVPCKTRQHQRVSSAWQNVWSQERMRQGF